jgi:hypothetical protein
LYNYSVLILRISVLYWSLYLINIVFYLYYNWWLKIGFPKLITYSPSFLLPQSSPYVNILVCMCMCILYKCVSVHLWLSEYIFPENIKSQFFLKSVVVNFIFLQNWIWCLKSTLSNALHVFLPSYSNNFTPHFSYTKSLSFPISSTLHQSVLLILNRPFQCYLLLQIFITLPLQSVFFYIKLFQSFSLHSLRTLSAFCYINYPNIDGCTLLWNQKLLRTHIFMFSRSSRVVHNGYSINICWNELFNRQFKWIV